MDGICFLPSGSTVQGYLSALEKAGAIKGQGRPKQYCVSNNIPSEALGWLRELEELARATRDFRGRTLSLLPKEKQLVADSPTQLRAVKQCFDWLKL